jgi:bisphosphoglycerate-dependent phosphoglycerate mutase
MVFSGWRDSGLTQKGVYQAQEIAKQLNHFEIDYAFSSHLKRAKQTLEIVLKTHSRTQIFIDDRLIERCYGCLQGKSKLKVAEENNNQYERCNRKYSLAPLDGESLEMVEKRVISFLLQFKEWIVKHPGNVAISCHNNSIRPLRRIFENLTLSQMCQIETPHNRALQYNLELENSRLQRYKGNNARSIHWIGVRISNRVKLATDPKNFLKQYY